MTFWQTLSVLLLSLALRLYLERKTALALTESLLLFALIQFSEYYHVPFIIVLIIFVISAFFQTEIEYFESVQEKNSYGTPLRCTAKSRNGGCPARSSGLERKGQHNRIPQKARSLKNNDTPQAAKALHGRVTMFPCDLRHLRRSGFKDNYHHSYLYAGYPVGLSASYGPLITVEPQLQAGFLLSIKRAWFSIRPEDHGFNGGASRSMIQKLEEFLLSEGEDPAEWPYAYLLAPPCVTRQLSNPLSFWYLYGSNKELSAMIVQLQTSYGERRLWLTRNCRKNTSRSGPYCFQGKFDKDLQVSPFTPLSASYVIDSSDPCAAPLDKLKVMVTLKQGKKTIMHAVVNSTGPPLDAATASVGSSVLFLIKWWWVPMCAVVVFRILSKAAKIYLTHSDDELNIQTRAEPVRTAIAKSARLSER
ncbi:hypothetical protein N7448_011173 [Penicillium atrosanguineum]|nr:hypothetical protein N7448_011173 [Penicillium atrosanguineum]